MGLTLSADREGPPWPVPTFILLVCDGDDHGLYKRSSRDAYLHRLAGRGFIYSDGDRIFATADGVHALGAGFKPLPTGRALRDYWMDKLPEGEAKVLRVALVGYPREVPVEAVDSETGYKRSSRDAYIQRLVARRLVERGRGTIKAARELF